MDIHCSGLEKSTGLHRRIGTVLSKVIPHPSKPSQSVIIMSVRNKEKRLAARELA